MSNLSHKLRNMALRAHRVRATVEGTAERPRLSIHVSNLHVTAQVIDDAAQNTLVYVSTIGAKNVGGTMTEKAAWVGAEIAKKAKAKKVSKVVFDRGSRLYHGRVKALADAARNGGLEF
jgi:large subunit ribosomal protein L18